MSIFRHEDPETPIAEEPAVPKGPHPALAPLAQLEAKLERMVGRPRMRALVGAELDQLKDALREP